MYRKTFMAVALVAAFTTGPSRAAGQAPQAQQAQHGAHADDGNLVQAVREATRPFHDVAAATAAGYGRFLGCVSGPQEGAMGVHYVNGPLVQDGLIDASRPEALMYESRNGRLRLLGVEYIVMAEAWHATHTEPPTLGGQVFHYNGSPNRYALPAFYELHVWAWRDNPGGTFADWNTRVTCSGEEGS
jgi:hypothetical protein